MPQAIPVQTGAEDFDFFVGDWKIRHRQLRTRLAGDTEWLEFDGTAAMRKFLNGLGNLDETEIRSPRGHYHGATLRLFDPATGAWSIYWMDSRNSRIDTPMVGRFEAGVGRFFADEDFDGRPIKVRFLWDFGVADAVPVGAGLFRRRRRQLGDQLDHELHPRLIPRRDISPVRLSSPNKFHEQDVIPRATKPIFAR